MHQHSRINLAHQWAIVLVLWALIIPAALAEESQTTTKSADASRLGPDQTIVDIVSVRDAPPIHHHGHHEHEHRIVEPRSSSSTSSSTFPTAFDTSLSNNFTTTTCPTFFKDFLSDDSFTNCYAISTLLRDSTGFFHTLTSAAATSRVLDLACAANVTSCASTLSDLASNLIDDSNCGKDYADGNPLVTNAYVDLITYEPIYRATCLQNPDTSDYCFVDAVTNTSNAADYDVYSLPYGSTINNATTLPTCSSCLQATLDIFSEWAQVEKQPLADSYLTSAEAVNTKCGSDFANVNITVGVEDDFPSAASPPLALSLPLWISSLTIGVSLVLSF
ncbi:uncharacterized protein DSM5745_08338 [Aspergillus mulundensis]|uniref:DUF7729 domain-containing protein n=1 Tax=Aspergillus mulundensis TaxID=1810919 RepID=A0A3D8R9V3_9EURO|nr:Uncharacterized protein DSM5745_08338 [Aspergillus mulundensis]RDW70827.1 Uncharacterized protein DSM5745_08338 [Aspergillus mulundensis]